MSAELINRWHHKPRCSEESHDDLWIRCCETCFATEAAVAMFTLSTVSSEASAEQDIFRHGCEGDLRQGLTVVLRGGHHCSTASPSTVRSGGLLSLTSTRFKVISPSLWRTFSGRARGGSSPWGITQENKVTKGSKEQDVKHEEQESVGSLKFVVELTSDRACANAELSAVMQHLRQVEQRVLCQGLAHRLTEVTPWCHRPAALWVCVNSGSLFCHTSSCFVSMSRKRESVGRKKLVDRHAPCVFECVRSLERQPC